MKISEFTISNYKSFKNQNNRVNTIKDINLIFGENNSGKSNILKFLNLIFSSKFVKESLKVEGEDEEMNNTLPSPFFDGLIEDEPYIFHKNNTKNNIKFSFRLETTIDELQKENLSFLEDLKKYYIKNNKHKDIPIFFEGYISSIDKRSLSEIKLTNLKISNKIAFKELNNKTKIFPNADKNSGLNGNTNNFKQFMSIFNNLVTYIDNERFFGYEIYEIKKTEISSKKFKNWLYNFSLDEFRYNDYQRFEKFIKENSIDCLKPLKDSNISFSINENGKLEILLNNGFERLPIDSYGTSLGQILYILAKIYITKSKVVLIEEIEMNLSPKTQKDLFLILKKLIQKGTINQVFFTSHSDYYKFRNDNFSTYEVSINEDGESSIAKCKLTSKPLLNQLD